jgi:acyl-CoA thioesterase FadM
VLLLLRFLRVIFIGLISPRRGALEESVLRFRVWPNDIDLNLHINDGRYLSLMGLGRGDLLVRSGLLRKALKRKWAPVIGGAMIRYRREVRAFAKFRLRSRILGWDEKWIYITHVIESGGKTCSVAYVRGALRSAAGAVPTKDVLELGGWTLPSPPLPSVVTDWPQIDA